MSGVVWSPIMVVSDDLYVLDAGNRLYVGLSHDKSYLHVVSPSLVDVTNPDTGELLRREGDLTCKCKGWTFRRECWRVNQAIAFEAGDGDQVVAPSWMRDFDAPVGAGESVEASRG